MRRYQITPEAQPEQRDRLKERALRAFERAVALDPLNEHVHWTRGIAFNAFELKEDALRSWQEAARLYPKHRLAHLNVASILARRGDRAGAIQAYRAAWALEPIGDEPSREKVAAALRALGAAPE